MMIQYTMHKDFTYSLQKMGQQGGESKRIADKVWGIRGKAQSAELAPFHGVQLTNKHPQNLWVTSGSGSLPSV